MDLSSLAVYGVFIYITFTNMIMMIISRNDGPGIDAFCNEVFRNANAALTECLL